MSVTEFVQTCLGVLTAIGMLSTIIWWAAQTNSTLKECATSLKRVSRDHNRTRRLGIKQEDRIDRHDEVLASHSQQLGDHSNRLRAIECGADDTPEQPGLMH